MKKNLFTLLGVLLTFTMGMRAQVTTNPDPLQEDSEGVTIYFHADEGNKGLMNMPSDTHIYAHTGVEVENTNGGVTDWKYAPSWEEDNDKYRLEYVSPNLWKLYIGDIRTYYGVAANETVRKLCFVFRDSGGNNTGRAEGDADIYVDVLDNSFQLAFRKSIAADVLSAPKSVTFTATTTAPAEISLYINNELISTVKDATQLRQAYDFNTPNDYTIKAVATAEGKTLEKSINMVYAGDSEPSADTKLPKQGVTKNADGTYTFCVAAPEKSSVMVVGSWNNYTVKTANIMKYVDRMIEGQPFRYFVLTLPAKETGNEFIYYYLVDGATAVGDPYAIMVLDPYNDKYISSEVYPDLPEYPNGLVPNNTMLAWYGDKLLDYKWSSDKFDYPTKDNLVIYEMLFRDFTGTEGAARGNGTVKLAIEKLEYLKNLGVNAVELLPINEFNGNNSWGYNPNFYFAVDKAYGTPQDYKEFIDKCHELGMAVILDVVFNQSDGLHPWYQMYGGVQKSPFYNWGLGGENGAPHAYSVLNDWNQGYPLVEEQWYDMVQFWLTEYKVDGFRFDLVKGLGDNTSYANASDNNTNRYNATRVARMKRIHDAMRKVNPYAYFINENLASAQEENEMADDGELNWANVNDPGCQYAMAYQSNASLNRMWAKNDGRTVGSTVAYLESHDEQRLAYKQITWGVDAIKNNHAAAMQRCGSAAAQMILVPGSHMIWMFSEMGNAQSTKSDNGGNNTSPKIVNWNLLEDPDNNGLMENYSELIKFRLTYQSFFAPDSNYKLSFGNWTNCRYANATVGDEEMHLVVNPSVTDTWSQSVDFLTNDNDNYFIYSQSYGSNATFDAAAGQITVPANSYALVTTKKLTETKYSGVGKVTKDSQVSIYPVDGGIHVSGSNGAIAVYSLTGVKVASASEDCTISIAPGVYIVRAGNNTSKVLVK